ncbi:MAG: hypothetical protein IJ660_01950 [Alphaproteobacteria bacterium]|nr:hypothetical protein [Alphaproteobacteria bacterium]
MCSISTIVSVVSAISSVAAAGVSWYKEIKLSQQLKLNKFNDELNEIVKDIDTYLELCRQYWMVAGLSQDERTLRASEITYKGKNISSSLTIINKKYKTLLNRDIVDYIRDFNEIKSKATGGTFQTQMFRLDRDCVIQVQDLVASFRENIKNERK